MGKETMTLVDAVNAALHYEMKNDADVVVLGEDIGTNGGVFRATLGLRDSFGVKRVIDTPLAEASIVGASIGMASQGLKPVAEIQFMGFILPALEQLICHAPRMRNRTRGRLTCPLVVRVPFGGGIHAPEHHSESTETLLAHIPGLQVVIPSSPARAYGLLLSAIRNPDPVVFLEPKRIYRAVRQAVANDGVALPLGCCFTLREGTDLTLVSWGACVHEALEATTSLAKEGLSVELIDVASLNPLDIDTIEASVSKTGRLLIVHEAPRSFGCGAEIAAEISSRCHFELQAPVERLTGYDITMPYYRLESHYMISSADIIDRVKRLMEMP